MKTIQFDSISLSNFGKHTGLTSRLGRRTHIKGPNATGKSTIVTAISYNLGCKAEDGKEITGIRPHDKDGVDLEDLVTVDELTVSVDGELVALKKEYYQKKNKKGESSGNTTDYYIEGVKKKKADYEAFVSEILPSEICINARAFLALDMPKRRELLEKQFGECSDDDILREFSEFEPIAKKLKFGSVAELLKACRAEIKDLEKKRDTVPARIEELEKTKADVDFAELELQKNALNEQISENLAKQSGTAKQYEEYDKMSADVMDLQFRLSDLQNKANNELAVEWRKINIQKSDVEHRLQEVVRMIADNERQISRNEQDKKNATQEREELLKRWNEVKAEHFDESEKTCPRCGQPLPEKDVADLMSDFEQKKAEQLEMIEKDGLDAKNRIKKATEQIEELKKLNERNTVEKDDLESQIAEFEKQLSEQPKVADLSENEEYKAIKQQIVEKEKAMQECNSATAIRQALKNEETDLRQQLSEVEKQLARAEQNNEIDDRISQLQKQQRELSQQIADKEREEDLLKQFEYKKNELLEQSVNKHFNFVQFRLFEKQVNGELKQVCNPIIDGESYDRRLNTGFKVLAEIDICLAFQRAYGIVAPLIIDNAECLDSWRLPKVENQMILIERTDDNELRIEVE